MRTFAHGEGRAYQVAQHRAAGYSSGDRSWLMRSSSVHVWSAPSFQSLRTLHQASRAHRCFAVLMAAPPHAGRRPFFRLPAVRNSRHLATFALLCTPESRNPKNRPTSSVPTPRAGPSQIGAPAKPPLGFPWCISGPSPHSTSTPDSRPHLTPACSGLVRSPLIPDVRPRMRHSG